MSKFNQIAKFIDNIKPSKLNSCEDLLILDHLVYDPEVQKFYFGGLVRDFNDTTETSNMSKAISEGVVSLPYKKVCFSYDLYHGATIFIYVGVSTCETQYVLHTYEYYSDAKIISKMLKLSMTVEEDGLTSYGYGDEILTTKYYDNRGEPVRIDRMPNDKADAALFSILSCLCLINNRSTRQVKSMGGGRLSKRKIGNNKGLLEHTIISLNDQARQLSDSVGGGLRFFRSHYRRGHVRSLSSGEKTWVKSCFVTGNAAGIVEHDYEVCK